MNKLKAYWIFHKSTLTINIITSASFSLIYFQLFFRLFPTMMMTAGTMIGIFYKEITHQNEYYFYYNLGISKANLIAVNALLNILTGLMLLLIFSYVKPS